VNLTIEETQREKGISPCIQHKLIVPRYRLNGFGRQRFAVAGPSTWNSPPDSLRDPELSLDTFKRQLKTNIFTRYWRQNVLSALEIFLSMRCINWHFTYLLTCVCLSGPSKATSSDLWHMAWQLNSSRIIMLCNLTEDGRVRILDVYTV